MAPIFYDHYVFFLHFLLLNLKSSTLLSDEEFQYDSEADPDCVVDHISPEEEEIITGVLDEKDNGGFWKRSWQAVEL